MCLESPSVTSPVNHRRVQMSSHILLLEVFLENGRTVEKNLWISFPIKIMMTKSGPMVFYSQDGRNTSDIHRDRAGEGRKKGGRERRECERERGEGFRACVEPPSYHQFHNSY